MQITQLKQLLAAAPSNAPFATESGYIIVTALREYAQKTMGGEKTLTERLVNDVPVAYQDAEHFGSAQELAAAYIEAVEALRGLLASEGAHSIGCKEYAPGYDDSRCCPVHIARTVLAKAVAA